MVVKLIAELDGYPSDTQDDEEERRIEKEKAELYERIKISETRINELNDSLERSKLIRDVRKIQKEEKHKSNDTFNPSTNVCR